MATLKQHHYEHIKPKLLRQLQYAQQTFFQIINRIQFRVRELQDFIKYFQYKFQQQSH